MTDIRAAVPARLSGLDGLRALAVALVVAYHLFPAWWTHSGFVGVDVFFVISGFLITTLLLDEGDGTGRIRLGRFWQRRARRLLPALALLVTVCATAAWVIGGDVLVKLGAQILGAATFSYNWVSIAAGTQYFSADTPELFRNLWSLAVEEQFYVLWPLILPLFLLLPRTWLRVVVAAVLGAASAVWMAALVLGGADLTRAYFGTDSHAFGILIGVALAFGLRRVLRSPAEWMSRPAFRGATLAAGLVAIGGLVVIAALPDSEGIATFPGALLGTSLLTAVAIAAGAWPRSWFGRAIDVQPLKWLGDRSYGIYLWHWPLLVLAVAWLQGTGPEAGVPVWIGLGVLAATLVIAELSYRFVERPVRAHGFRGSVATVGRRLAGSPAARFGALSGLAAWAIVLGGTTAAVAAAPQVSSAQTVVADGQAALDEATASESETDAADPSASDTPRETASAPAPSVTAPTAPGTTAPPLEGPPPPPTPTPVGGKQITAVGDSVMLASARALLERFPGASIDAKVSRSVWAAPAILAKLERAGKLRPYVVLALGTNGPVNKRPLQQVLDIVGPDRQLILVDAFAPRSWIRGVNRDLRAFAAAHDNVSIAAWSKAIAPHVDLLAGDHIHPGLAGGRIFAEAVATALDAAESDRLRAAYAVELARYRDEHPALDDRVR
jgi:peptidoglycan/LPS O-acetylase OafA/YrhL